MTLKNPVVAVAIGTTRLTVLKRPIVDDFDINR